MPRFILLSFLLLVALLGAVGLLEPAVIAQPATASTPLQVGMSGAAVLPAATCDFTPLSFTFAGPGPIEDRRPFSVTVGDTFEQFIAPPITATVASTASVMLNNGFTGTVTGGISGSFVMTNLNGLLITSPEGFATSPRGFEVNELV